MKADELFELAKQYVAERKPDTIEICAFVEWAYRKEGRTLENMELLDEIETDDYGRAGD